MVALMDRRAHPILKHLNEVRVRALRVSIIALIFIVISLVFYRQIIDFFSAPVSGLILNNGGSLNALRLTEPWGVAARIAILTGLIMAWPFLVWEVSAFLRAGLKRSEAVYVYLVGVGSTILFAAGAMFAYYLIAPFFFGFLIRFGNNISSLALTPSIESTLGLLISLMFSMGLVFQLPLAMFALAKFKVVKPGWFASKRRWNILLAFITGAALTPTIDPLTQLLVATPIILLYELGLILIATFDSRPFKRVFGQRQEQKV